MAEFAYNNAKNTSTSYTSFELNCGFYFQVWNKKYVDLCSKSKAVDVLATQLRKLTNICQENY